MTSGTHVPKDASRPPALDKARSVRHLAGSVKAHAEAQTILKLLVSNAVSLASATILTSVLGVAYWFVAARTFSAAAVGFASAAVSGMTLAATFAALGLGTYAMGDAQRVPGRRRALVTTALVASAISGSVLGLVYALVIPFLASDLRQLSSTVYGVFIFALCCVASAVGGVLDSSLLGALRGRIQLYRNLLFGVAKLVLVLLAGFLLVHRTGLSLFSTWAAGTVLSLVAVAIAQPSWTRAFLAELKPSAAVTFIREVARPVMRHQALNLGLRIPLLALPLLVVSVVSLEANANFYIDWQLTNAAFVLPGSLAVMLYAIGADDRRALAQRLKFTISLAMGLTVIAGALLAVGSHLILSIFGPNYADNGAVTLIILAFAGIPTVVKNHYVTVARVTGGQRAALPLVYVGAALEMVSAFFGGHRGGLTGFAAGWVIALTIEACFMVPSVSSAIRGQAKIPAPADSFSRNSRSESGGR